MNGALITAGSTPTRRATSGSSEPTNAASVQTASSVRLTTMAMSCPTKTHAGPKARAPRIAPSSRPTRASRRMTTPRSSNRTSPTAKARVTVVAACAPVLPPVPMISGMKSASFTTSLRVVLEDLEHVDGQGRRHDQEEQPDDPRAGDAQHRGRHVRAAQRLGASGAGKVLGLLLLEDLHGIVDRDDSDQAVLGVDDRQRQQVGLADQACSLFLVRVDAGREDLGVHQVADQCLGIGQDQVAQAERPDQAAMVVGDGERVDRLGRSPDLAQPIQAPAGRSCRRGGWQPRAT